MSIKPINIQAIPHTNHRYPTVGDYWDAAESLEVRTSQMSDPRYEQLVIIHELVEIFLLQKRGLTLKDTDDFDIMFEKEREEGKHGPDEEPGDDPRCPYRKEHRIAETIERMLAIAIEVDWSDYDKEVMGLP